jgi:hypothetical protein
MNKVSGPLVALTLLIVAGSAGAAEVRGTLEAMHAASAEIGVATANELPRFTISADFETRRP